MVNHLKLQKLNSGRHRRRRELYRADSVPNKHGLHVRKVSCIDSHFFLQDENNMTLALGILNAFPEASKSPYLVYRTFLS